MLKITRWSPDTCGCILDYEWDDSLDENSRTHTIKNIIKPCAAHANLSDKTEHYGKVLEENQRKNNLLGAIVENVVGVSEETTQNDDSKVKQLKLGKEYRFSYDDERNLVVELSGFTNSEKTAVVSLANNLFPNKVEVK